ncbi:response regulator receiver and unknown domain protein [Thermosinus carboxydivorans Nor1]|uniref:Transcriptional regulatory protein n=1 Tax=Thermosinus carboxydivorans Nor1 TaxID=401526 RepID=A1HNG4_9FIRM|nr:response regulator receiver and unknown domain protein [Thermosinus carboxydivorans Nor1]
MDDIRVLIVEDDPMVAEINKKFTEAVTGFTVVGVVKDGAAALAFVAQKSVDLIILDNYLPEKTGVEVLAELRRRDQPVDVIMVTAADDSKTVSRILRQGVVGYIAKPFKFERYRAVLEAYRSFREKTLKKTNLAQEDIDEMFSVRQRSAGPDDIPKNFSQQTMNLIIDFLANQTAPLSAEEIAAGVGISRVTARRYLEYFVDLGRVQRTMEYLTVGRPVHRFKLVL